MTVVSYTDPIHTIFVVYKIKPTYSTVKLICLVYWKKNLVGGIITFHGPWNVPEPLVDLA
jgi:hypothetical protein